MGIFETVAVIRFRLTVWIIKSVVVINEPAAYT